MEESPVKNLSIPLERDIFFRKLIRELAHTLEDVVGYHETMGYISLVGQKMGEWINELYTNGLGVKRLSQEQVGEVLVDLKKRIYGEFSLESYSDQKMTLSNKSCPFGNLVVGCPSMCMMTSNVFGYITAKNIGYAKVCLDKTIARGDPNCHITVFIKLTPECEEAKGREYFGDV